MPPDQPDLGAFFMEREPMMFDTTPTMKIETVDGTSWISEEDASWYLNRVTSSPEAWSQARGTKVRLDPERKLANYQDFVKLLMELPQ